MFYKAINNISLNIIENQAYSLEYVGDCRRTNYIFYYVTGDTNLFESNNPSFSQETNLDQYYLDYNGNRYFDGHDYTSVLKNKTRELIEENVGDIFDLVTDLSRRLAMNERLLLRTMQHILRNEAIPQTIIDKYLPLIDLYVTGVDNGVIRDRTDLEDYINVFNNLIERGAKINDYVEDYLEKLNR